MRTVTARVSFEGVHSWPEAPDEVTYLREPHRHIFNVCASVEVFHNDRELEFIMLGHRLKALFADKAKGDPYGVWQMGRTSCEQVCEMAIRQIKADLGPRPRYISVSVDEDGENGSTVDNFEWPESETEE